MNLCHFRPKLLANGRSKFAFLFLIWIYLFSLPLIVYLPGIHTHVHFEPWVLLFLIGIILFDPVLSFCVLEEALVYLWSNLAAAPQGYQRLKYRLCFQRAHHSLRLSSRWIQGELCICLLCWLFVVLLNCLEGASQKIMKLIWSLRHHCPLSLI